MLYLLNRQLLTDKNQMKPVVQYSVLLMFIIFLSYIYTWKVIFKRMTDMLGTHMGAKSISSLPDAPCFPSG